MYRFTLDQRIGGDWIPAFSMDFGSFQEALEYYLKRLNVRVQELHKQKQFFSYTFGNIYCVLHLTNSQPYERMYIQFIQLQKPSKK